MSSHWASAMARFTRGGIPPSSGCFQGCGSAHTGGVPPRNDEACRAYNGGIKRRTHSGCLGLGSHWGPDASHPRVGIYSDRAPGGGAKRCALKRASMRRTLTVSFPPTRGRQWGPDSQTRQQAPVPGGGGRAHMEASGGARTPSTQSVSETVMQRPVTCLQGHSGPGLLDPLHVTQRATRHSS